MRTYFYVLTFLFLSACQHADKATDRVSEIAPVKAPTGTVQELVTHYAKKHGVPVAFAHKIAQKESRYNPRATSPVGARGVMQVMPATAAKWGVNKPDLLYTPRIGIETGMKELNWCLKKTKGNFKRAGVCYNCGPGCLTRKTLPRETRNYINDL